MKNKRILGFDILRAIAIFLVINGHGIRLLNVNLQLDLPNGVDIFFVLSGYFIGKKFIEKLAENKLTKTDVFGFWKRAALRLLPLFYTMLFINIVCAAFGIISVKLGDSVFLVSTFTQNIFRPIYNIYWEAWSLSVQVWFYIGFPLLLIFFRNFISSLKSIKLSIGIFIFLPLLYRLITSEMEVNSFQWDIWFRKLVATRLDTIGFGLLAAYFQVFFKHYWEKYAFVMFCAGILFFTAIALIQTNIGSFFSKTFYFSLIPIPIALILPYLSDIWKNKQNSFVSWVSSRSYAMYLCNLLILQIIYSFNLQNLFLSNFLSYIIFVALVFLISELLYRIVETPFLNLRKNINK